MYFQDTYAIRHLFETDHGENANKTQLLETYSSLLSNKTHKRRITKLSGNLFTHIDVNLWSKMFRMLFPENFDDEVLLVSSISKKYLK